MGVLILLGERFGHWIHGAVDQLLSVVSVRPSYGTPVTLSQISGLHKGYFVGTFSFKGALGEDITYPDPLASLRTK